MGACGSTSHVEFDTEKDWKNIPVDEWKTSTVVHWIKTGTNFETMSKIQKKELIASIEQNKIVGNALKTLNEQDLKDELKLPIGTRRTFLIATSSLFEKENNNNNNNTTNIDNIDNAGETSNVSNNTNNNNNSNNNHINNNDNGIGYDNNNGHNIGHNDSMPRSNTNGIMLTHKMISESLNSNNQIPQPQPYPIQNFDGSNTFHSTNQQQRYSILQHGNNGNMSNINNMNNINPNLGTPKNQINNNWWDAANNGDNSENDGDGIEDPYIDVDPNHINPDIMQTHIPTQPQPSPMQYPIHNNMLNSSLNRQSMIQPQPQIISQLNHISQHTQATYNGPNMKQTQISVNTDIEPSYDKLSPNVLDIMQNSGTNNNNNNNNMDNGLYDINPFDNNNNNNINNNHGINGLMNQQNSLNNDDINLGPNNPKNYPNLDYNGGNSKNDGTSNSSKLNSFKKSNQNDKMIKEFARDLWKKLSNIVVKKIEDDNGQTLSGFSGKDLETYIKKHLKHHFKEYVTNNNLFTKEVLMKCQQLIDNNYIKLISNGESNNQQTISLINEFKNNTTYLYQFVGIKHRMFIKEEEPDRGAWTRGTKVKINSSTFKKWLDGTIIEVNHDNLSITYGVKNTTMKKTLDRYANDLVKSTDEFIKTRQAWKKGDSLEVYSQGQHMWCPTGKIDEVLPKNENQPHDIFRVFYTNSDGKDFSKYLDRWSPFLRPKREKITTKYSKGTKIMVFSNGQQKWVKGKVIDIVANNITVRYGDHEKLVPMESDVIKLIDEKI